MICWPVVTGRPDSAHACDEEVVVVAGGEGADAARCLSVCFARFGITSREADAGQRGLDRAERAANLLGRVGLGVEGVEVRDAAGHEQHDDRLGFASGRAYPGRASKTAGLNPPARHSGSAVAATPTPAARRRSRRERSGKGMVGFLAGSPIIAGGGGECNQSSSPSSSMMVIVPDRRRPPLEAPMFSTREMKPFCQWMIM